ncbi:MAG TPA: glycosyltransferase family 2 protein [Chryseosolibacter sp.]|nr:glycosyltransferase family 2 protein [Chryseosolibacter sp.]
MINVAVVILNYNGEKLLQQFLPSVIQCSETAQIIVADNGSSDRSVELLRKKFPGVSVLELEENYGFCGGYNRALRQINADYFVLLNSDVEVTPRWLEPLTILLDTRPEIAAVQPKILSYNERNRFEYAGAGGGFLDSLGYPFCRGRIFDHLEEDRGQYNDERPVFWASGACMMIRSEKFHQHNGLDEDLFAHMEEIDLCWKLNRAGSVVYYSGKSVVYHIGAGTLGYHHPRKTFLNFRNGLSLIFKHLDTGELFYKLPLRMVLDWLAAVFFLIKGQGRNFVSVFRAHASFLGQLGRLMSKRRSVRREYPTYPRNNIHRGLIIVDYYLRKRKSSPF